MSESKKENRLQPARPENESPPPPPLRPVVDETYAAGQPGLRGQRERPRGPRRVGGKAKDDSRKRGRGVGSPVPAREALDRPPAIATPLAELPSRSFSVDGVSWVGYDTGRTAIGSRPDSRACLMQLTFSREGGDERVEMEILTPADSLELMSDEQLIALLAKARVAGDGSADAGQPAGSQPTRSRAARFSD